MNLTAGQIVAVLAALDGNTAASAVLAAAKEKLREALTKRIQHQQRTRQKKRAGDPLLQEGTPSLLKNNTDCTRCGGGGCVHCMGD